MYDKTHYNKKKNKKQNKKINKYMLRCHPKVTTWGDSVYENIILRFPNIDYKSAQKITAPLVF